MQMTDLSFLLYFLPVLLLGYFALQFSRRAQNVWLAVGSLVFYALGNPTYLALLFLLTLANYYLGYQAQQRRRAARSIRLVVGFTVALNLLPLFFFKYLHPMLDTVAGWLGTKVPAFPVIPLGIAVLALQGISYVVDIGRGNAKWSHHFTDAVLYLAFFTPLAHGPLLRYRDIAPQIEARKTGFDKVARGLGRFVVGLGKVVLIGNTLITMADIAFDQSNISGVYTTVPVSLALLGLVAYALGLYHTLSGFSDMVIGLGLVFGFEYPENFKHPLLASSMTSFWNRSYISLGAWFNEYVYRPLGKNRSNSDRMVYHLVLMWVLIGLWTGPGWPRILFGVLNFFFILIERVVELNAERESKNPLRYLYVMVVVLLSLVALRTDTFYQFTLFLANLFGMRDNGFFSPLAMDLLRESWPALALGLVCSFPIGQKLRQLGETHGHPAAKAAYVLYPLAMAALAGLVIVALTHSSYEPGQIARMFLWRSS